MKTRLIAAVAAATITFGIGFAYAQMHHGTGQGASGGHGPGMMQGMQHGGGHGSGGHGAAAAKGDNGPASLAFRGINAKMHEGMDIAFSGNVDADFIRGMIPHHQGAVDMAKVVIAFGKDAEVRKLAEAVIKAQEEEIAWMQAWLKKNGG
jgi:uncharacterized protein (DUF305 family)